MKSGYPFNITARLRRRLSGTFRVYNRALRITREGWFLTGFIFAVGIAAINTGNNLLYLVLAVMLGAVVASGILSEESVRRIWLKRDIPAEIWAGEEFQIHYSVINRQRRLTAYGLRIEEAAIAPVRRAFIMQVEPMGRVKATAAYKAEKRGMLSLGEVRLSTNFPFGFFDKIRLIELPARTIVFPRPAEVNPEISGGLEWGSSECFSARGEGPDLLSLRPYTEGDGLRRIHWKASAHADSLVSKETGAENLPTVSIILDTSGYVPHRDDEALEGAVSAAAGYTKEFLNAGHMVRLMTPTGEIPFGMGAGHMRRIMTHLALFKPPIQARSPAAVRPDENRVIITLKTGAKSPVYQFDLRRRDRQVSL